MNIYATRYWHINHVHFQTCMTANVNLRFEKYIPGYTFFVINILFIFVTINTKVNYFFSSRDLLRTSLPVSLGLLKICCEQYDYLWKEIQTLYPQMLSFENVHKNRSTCAIISPSESSNIQKSSCQLECTST